MIKLSHFLLLVGLFGFIFKSYSQILINEVMQSNIDCIMDDLNEFPDSWVELYNCGNQDMNIEGYVLSLESNGEDGYELPSAVVPAHGYLLLYCDKENTGLHTSFRLDSGKGSLYLFDAESNQVDGIKTLKKQPAPNIAYGRVTDGSDEWGYQLTPSPGATNTGVVSDVVLSAPIFSELGGVWNDTFPISLELSLPEDAPQNAIIRYTIDGKEPTKEYGMTYSESINIVESVSIRAKLFADGCLSIPSTVQSYIFLDREQKIPLVSIVIDPDYLYDDEIGIYVEGKGGSENPNYKNDWRRPLNMEYFTVDGNSELNQLCEMRIQGGATRAYPLRSLALYANKRFGTKRFEYEFWQKDKPGISDNKSFLLRNGGNNYGRSYIIDGLVQRVIGRHTDVDWQGYSPVIVYINGEYHGMLALRERSNEDNVYANYDGLEDIDMIENWRLLKEGSIDDYNIFKNFFMQDGGHTMNEWESFMDIEEYTNMMIGEIWINNIDFPNNNIVLWRDQSDNGRWRWLLKDCDCGLGGGSRKDESVYDNNTLEWLEAMDNHGSKLFFNLLLNPEYKEYFISKWIVSTGDFLNETTFLNFFDEIDEENHGELYLSNQKWHDHSSLDDYFTWTKNWIYNRERYAPSMIQNYFELGKPVTVKINQDLSDEEIGKTQFTYDNIPLVNKRFNGKDYVGRKLKLSADGEVEGWNVTITGKPMEYYEGKELELSIDQSSTIKINAVVSASLDCIEMSDNSEIVFDSNNGIIYAKGAIEVFDLQGRKIVQSFKKVSLPSRGCYIINKTKIVW